MQSLQSTVGRCFFIFISVVLITAFQLEYCCFYAASAGLLSLARVITPVKFVLQNEGGESNESFCFARSHNFPSEVLIKQLDANLGGCDHFLQLTPQTITLVTGGGSPTGDSTLSLIHHSTSKHMLISQEQSDDL